MGGVKPGDDCECGSKIGKDGYCRDCGFGRDMLEKYSDEVSEMSSYCRGVYVDNDDLPTYARIAKQNELIARMNLDILRQLIDLKAGDCRTG